MLSSYSKICQTVAGIIITRSISRFFFEFHFWRRVFDIWSNCGGALMHNLSQVSSSTLGSQKAMFLHDEAIIMYLGLNCTHCTGPVWSPLSTQTLVPFSAFQMWTRPSVEPEITNWLSGENEASNGICLEFMWPYNLKRLRECIS